MCNEFYKLIVSLYRTTAVVLIDNKRLSRDCNTTEAKCSALCRLFPFSPACQGFSSNDHLQLLVGLYVNAPLTKKILLNKSRQCMKVLKKKSGQLQRNTILKIENNRCIAVHWVCIVIIKTYVIVIYRHQFST